MFTSSGWCCVIPPVDLRVRLIIIRSVFYAVCYSLTLFFTCKTKKKRKQEKHLTITSTIPFPLGRPVKVNPSSQKGHRGQLLFKASGFSFDRSLEGHLTKRLATIRGWWWPAEKEGKRGWKVGTKATARDAFFFLSFPGSPGAGRATCICCRGSVSCCNSHLDYRKKKNWNKKWNEA